MPDRREALFLGLIFIVALGLISIPYGIAASGSGPNYVFGGFLINPIDGNTYLAKMYQGWQGAWKVKLPYTVDQGQGAYLFLFYIFLGHFAHFTGLNLAITYHLARLFSGIILWVVLWWFFRCAFGKSSVSRWAFVLAVFGSGMGWLVVLAGYVTSDFWVAEAFPFLSAYTSPHFSLGLALLVWLLTPNWNRAPSNGSIHYIFLGLASCLLGVLSPFGIVIAGIALGGCFVWYLVTILIYDRCRVTHNRVDGIPEPLDEGLIQEFTRVFIRWCVVILCGLPILIYYQWVVHHDPVWAAWNAQNVTPAPSVIDFVLSFSPALVLAFWGAFAFIRATRLEKSNYPSSIQALTRHPGRLILLFWAFSSVCMIFIPFNLQRRFLMGLYVPLAGLAALGAKSLADVMHWNLARWMRLVLFISLPTNLLVVVSAGQGIVSHDPRIYLYRSEVAAFSWINQNTPQDAIILSAPETGLFIPAYTGRRVFYGHPFETIAADQREAEVISYYQGMNPDQLLNRADYVYVGPRELALGEPSLSDNLRMVYRSVGVTIYQVMK